MKCNSSLLIHAKAREAIKTLFIPKNANSAEKYLLAYLAIKYKNLKDQEASDISRNLQEKKF